ncbi:GAF domain-containing protein [Arthrobacter sp. MDT3-44]
MPYQAGITDVGPGPGSLVRREMERQRLLSLDRSGLLETGDEERFDLIVRRTQEAFGVSAASIALITEDHQFLRSFVGPLARTVDRQHAFCNVTIQSEELLIVPDTLKDPRFSTNPLVVGNPKIRFYAGCPLRGPGGWLVGTLCAIDQQPRPFGIGDQRVLRALAVEAELELNAKPIP